MIQSKFLISFPKGLVLIVFMLGSSAINGQETNTYNHFRINTEEGYIEIQCLPTKKPDIEISDERTYTWSNRDAIFETQGGFSYYLLHGPYERFDKNGQLMEKGNFENGLRTSRWTKWQISGKLLEDAHYRDGLLHGMVNYYDKNGKIHKSAQYNKGVLDGCTFIYEADTLKAKNKYRNGKLVNKDDAEDN